MKTQSPMFTVNVAISQLINALTQWRGFSIKSWKSKENHWWPSRRSWFSSRRLNECDASWLVMVHTSLLWGGKCQSRRNKRKTWILFCVRCRGGARGVSRVALDTPDIWLATPGATLNFYLLLVVWCWLTSHFTSCWKKRLSWHPVPFQIDKEERIFPTAHESHHDWLQWMVEAP